MLTWVSVPSARRFAYFETPDQERQRPAQGFQWIARIGPLVQIPRAGSQIATALAVRELHFAIISNDVVHFPGPSCLYIQGSDQKNSSPIDHCAGGIRIA